MYIDRPARRDFLPDRSAVWCAVTAGLLIVLLPVFAMAQTLTIEMARGPLEDKRLREAIVASTDWRQAAERTGLEVRDVIIRHANEVDPLRSTSSDLGKAKERLQEMGGVPERTPLILLYDPQQTAKLAQLVASNLRRLQLPIRLVELRQDARAQVLRTLRSRADISRSEPGYILLSWNFAALLTPRQPETARPKPPRPENAVPVRLPDLTIGALQLKYDPITRVLGARVLVQNVGRAPTTGPVTVELISLNDVLPGGLGRHNAGVLAPGAAVWLAPERQVPQAAVGQLAIVQARADPGGRIRESNLRNNTSDPTRILLERPPAPPLPDLVITRLEPEYDRAARRLMIRVDVHNAGKAMAGPSVVRIAEVDDRFDAPDISLPAIGPGGTAPGVAEMTVPAAALGQVAALRALANADGKLREADPDNNGFGPVRVVLERPPEPDRPDLVIAGFEAKHDPAAEEITVFVELRNQGRAASGPFEVQVFDHNQIVKMTGLRIAGLVSGQSDTRALRIPVQGATAPRMALLQARADPDERVKEADEDNNLSPPLRLVLQPPPEPEFPDLQLDRLIAQHDAIRGHVVLRVVVTNIGPVRSPLTRVRLSERQGRLRDVHLDLAPLAAGRRIILHTEAPLADSPEDRVLEFVAFADVDGRVRESREDNNQSQVMLLPVPASPVLLSDLAVVSLTAEQPRLGAPLMVAAKIINTGKAASKASVLTLGIDGQIVVTAALPALHPDEAHVTKLQVPVQTGLFGRTVEVSLEADPDGIVAETTRANNMMRRQVALLPSPLPWTGIAAVGALALLMMLWRLRRGAGRTPPQPPEHIPPHLVRLRPRADAGRQLAKAQPGAPAIVLEIALRPVRDPGHVTVVPLADRKGPET